MTNLFVKNLSLKAPTKDVFETVSVQMDCSQTLNRCCHIYYLIERLLFI